MSPFTDQMDCATTLSHDTVHEEEKVIKKVHFMTNVTIRHYDRTLGDHPGCAEGLPVTLGWTYSSEESRAVDEAPREVTVLTPNQRRKLLLGLGFTGKELRKQRETINYVRMQRSETLEMIYYREKIDRTIGRIKGLFRKQKGIERRKINQHKDSISLRNMNMDGDVVINLH